MDEQTTIFNKHRSELINIAYGMLGSLADAKDIVQDAYLRWHDTTIETIKNPENYLKTIVSRLCIDQYRLARKQREEYYGPWLPQPIADTDSKPADAAIELNDELTMALLHILENLSPDQRAIYLLHDVFGYTFKEVSRMVDKTPAACRKAAQRARNHIHENRPSDQHTLQNSKTIDQFLEALQHRDMETLRSLLTDDATFYSDGGGKATAAPKPIKNMKKVSRFLFSIADRNEDNVSIELTSINHQPGFKVFMSKNLHSLWSFHFKGKKIHKIYSVLNPDKLTGGI